MDPGIKDATRNSALAPASASVLNENDLHPEPARLAAAIRQLEIRVQTIERLLIAKDFLED